MENIFREKNEKINLMKPVADGFTKMARSKFGRNKVGSKVVMATAVASNLITWPVQVANATLRMAYPNEFTTSPQVEEKFSKD